MAARGEAFGREEFELRRIFEADAGRDLPLEKGGVGAQRLQHGGLILAEQRFDEDGCVAEVGGHARSEERRGGKEGVSRCRFRWTTVHKKKQSRQKDTYSR